MGNTCKPMAVSFQCMTKSLQIKHTHTKKKKKKKEKKSEAWHDEVYGIAKSLIGLSD